MASGRVTDARTGLLAGDAKNKAGEQTNAVDA